MRVWFTRSLRSTSVVTAAILHFTSLNALAQSTCSLSAGAPLPSAQIKNLCELECKAEASSESHSPLAPKPEECATANAEVQADLEEPAWKIIAECAVTAGYGSLSNLPELLVPDEFRMFVTTCSRDAACKRTLARDIEQYRQRKPDGSYQMSDDEVDSKMKNVNFVDEYFRSKHNVGSNMDVCQAQLAKITASLNNALSDSPTEADKQKQLQTRYDNLAKFDADCPRLLHIKPPGEDHFKPDLNRAVGNAAKSLIGAIQANSKASVFGSSVTDFFKNLKISYQCYDGATRRQLLCYAIGHAIDPTMIVGGGIGIAMGAKALIKSGMAKYAKREIIAAQKQVVTSAYARVDEIRGVREKIALAGGDTTELDSELAARKAAAGKAAIDYTFSRSAVLMDEAKFRALMNESSFPYIEQSVQFKPGWISSKTARAGDSAGLVLDPATGKPFTIDERRVASDADVKKRMRRFKAGPVTWTEKYGFESAASRASRESENAGFKEIDRRSIDREPVQHGPLEDLPLSVDKFHKPLVIEDKYPVTVYMPTGDIRIVHSKIEEDLLTRQLGAAGYK